MPLRHIPHVQKSTSQKQLCAPTASSAAKEFAAKGLKQRVSNLSFNDINSILFYIYFEAKEFEAAKTL
jgi:hypothetical protein